MAGSNVTVRWRVATDPDHLCIGGGTLQIVAFAEWAQAKLTEDYNSNATVVGVPGNFIDVTCPLDPGYTVDDFIHDVDLYLDTSYGLCLRPVLEEPVVLSHSVTI